VSQQQQRPPEWYVILMGCTGALIGYATAIAFKWTGRYAKGEAYEPACSLLCSQPHTNIARAEGICCTSLR